MPTPTPDSADVPAVHPLYLRLLAGVLAAHGVDPDALLAESGVRMSRLDDDVPLSLHTLRRVVELALRASGSPWLGLELGAAAQPISHGPLGFAAVASGSLRQALEIAVRYVSLRAPILRLTLRHGSRHTQLVFAENADLGPARRFVLEASAVMIERLLQSMSPQSMSMQSMGRARLQGHQLDLPWPEPSWSRHYRAFLIADCGFNARQMRLRLPNALLDAPCVSADPQTFELARLACEQRLQAGAAQRDLVSRIQRRLFQCEGRYPSADALASQLGLSLRTLYRELAAAQCSYRGLLDAARADQAKRLLREADLAVEQIAERLGYADASNFSRCFRRWTGLTPRDFRRTTPRLL